MRETHREQIEEIARKGQEIYDQRIRSHVEPQHDGAFLVMDVTTGSYEIADDDLTASDRVLAKNPDALLYGVRVGYDASFRIGFAGPGRRA